MSRDTSEPTPTIVGGQPIGKQGGGGGLPRGIEAILLLAAAEPSFRNDFARDRPSALRRAGIRLTDAEEAILDTVSDAELFAMATRAATTPAPGKRGVLATAVSLAALASLTTTSRTTGASNPEPLRTKPALSQFDVDEPGLSTNARVDDDSPTPTPTEIASFGIRPEDSPTPTGTPSPQVAGINPDDPTATPSPTQEWPPSPLGILPDTPTPTQTPTPTATQEWTPSPLGILPDTPTPTYTPTPTATETISRGLATDTPTPTETTPPIDGIRPDTPTATQTPSPTGTPDADLDGDGEVDHRDLLLFMQQWYKTRSEE